MSNRPYVRTRYGRGKWKIYIDNPSYYKKDYKNIWHDFQLRRMLDFNSYDKEYVKRRKRPPTYGYWKHGNITVTKAFRPPRMKKEHYNE